MELEIIKNILFIDYKNLYFEKQIYDEKYGKICNVYSCNNLLDIINCGNIWSLKYFQINIRNDSKYKYISKVIDDGHLLSSIIKYIELKNYIYLFKDDDGYRKNKIYENNETTNNKVLFIGYLNNILIYKKYYNNWISFNIRYNRSKIYLLKIYNGVNKNLELNKKTNNYKLI